MKKGNQQRNRTNISNKGHKKEFLIQKIDDPELKHIILDVISYSEEYEININNEDSMDWV